MLKKLAERMMFLALLMLSCQAAVGQASRPPSDWAAVRALHTGQRMFVNVPGDRVGCNLVSVSADGLVCPPTTSALPARR